MPYAKVAFNLPINEPFDYIIPQPLVSTCKIGCRVLAPFGRRVLLGVIVGLTAETKITKLKPILKALDTLPVFTQEVLTLTQEVTRYYCASWGQAIFAALPQGLRKGRPITILEKDVPPQLQNSNPKINFIQSPILEERLEIYAAQIAEVLPQKKTILILSPEIKSTLTIYNLLRNKYPSSVTIEAVNRKLKIQDESHIWERARNGQIDILIGTRGLVFAPCINPGLLIVDDEAAYGYKEEQAPYYQARDVALMRGRLEKIPVALGAPIPSLESFYAIKNKKYALLGSTKKEITPQPKITIVDIRHYTNSRDKFRGCISPVLEDRLQKVIAAGKKAILFLNRKGFASLAYCQKCGYILACDKCSLRLTFYFEEKKLICQACGQKKELLSLCPKCSARYISYKGLGIEKALSQLHLLFPGAKIARLDKEHQCYSADFQVLITTEMLFSHTDIPDVHLAAAIDIDSLLQFVNFRSNEKLYALLLKLKHRAQDELIIQTRLPEYFQRKECRGLILEKLFKAELKERRALGLPPFSHLIALNLRGKNMERVKAAATRLYENVKRREERLSIFEPIEAVPFKLRGNYRFTITLKVKNPLYVNSLLKEELKRVKTSGIIITVDVDPQ